jgi:NAD(P)-dependent dehydrogenase (short-subunit alcohol dehydrogenase family)
MRRFEDRIVLVTGAASGIGRAVAARLAAEGATLALADRDAAALAAVAADLGAQSHVYDAADGDGSAAMVGRVLAATDGRLDALIANAGVYRRAHFAAVTPADWDWLLAVNLTSHMRVTQAALPALTAARGNVVMTASTAALHGNAYAAPYAAAKGGIVALVKTLAVELAPAGVRVNAVCPGKVQTAIGAGLAPVDGADPALLVRPPKLAGRTGGGLPADLAGTYAWLASDDAAYVTGAVVVADGAQNIG